MQTVRAFSGGRVDLGAGTLYGAINTLLEKNWIRPVAGERDSRKKEYAITELGRSIVELEIRRLEELLSIGKSVVGGNVP